jgi:Zn-dependent metalloprotease
VRAHVPFLASRHHLGVNTHHDARRGTTMSTKQRTRRSTRQAAAVVLATLVLGQAAASSAASPPPDLPTAQADRTDPVVLAQATAAGLVRSKAPKLKVGRHDGFVAQATISSGDLHYTPYERTYRGLPVVGGDFVVVTDGDGDLLTTSVAQTRKVRLASVVPDLTASRAARIARADVEGAKAVGSPRLVVWQGRTSSHLAWEVVVSSTGDGADHHHDADHDHDHGAPSLRRIYIDAHTGEQVASVEGVGAATGDTAHSGQVTFPTTQSGASYLLRHPTQTNLECQDYSSRTVFTGTDDAWGNGDRLDLESACAEAMYVVEQERQMLSEWLGRDGMDGKGGWVPIRMGLDKVDAYYTSKRSVTLGHQRSGAWMSWIDVVAHEFGHGIDDHTPGGVSGDQTAEFVADAFGAATEHFANNASDTPDYLVGEEGDEAIRNMYDPAKLGHPGCFDGKKIAETETHGAAGPGNHWFYLLAEGSDPVNGQPKSPTCDGSTVEGVGVKSALQVLYNAMLMKTSSATYPKYRLWTLTAAKNMDASCGLYQRVKAAWDAVSVPAQAKEPTCGPAGSGGGSGTGGTGDSPCTGQLLRNEGFESGAVAWTADEGVIDDSDAMPARSGDWKAWLGGYGQSGTTAFSQKVRVPSGCRAIWSSTCA